MNYFKGRQAIYEFLFLAFYKVPDSYFVELIKNYAAFFIQLGGESSQLDIIKGSEILSGFVESIQDLPNDEAAQRLNISFSRLFLMGNKSVELRESRYGDEGLKTDKILSVTKFFSDSGLTPPSLINLPIDSLPVELYYLFKMAEKAADYFESDNESVDEIIDTHIDFMTRHLLSFIDAFTDSLTGAVNSQKLSVFYAGIAHLCRGFLQYDKTSMCLEQVDLDYMKNT